MAGPGKFFVTGLNVGFVDLPMLKDYVQQMVKMSPLQGYSLEAVEVIAGDPGDRSGDLSGAGSGGDKLQLLLAGGTEVRAAATNHDALDGCAADAARLASARINVVVKLEKSGDAIRVHIVGDR